MLNFRNTTIVFAAMFIVLAPGYWFFDFPVGIFFVLILIYFSILAYGSCRVDSGFYVSVTCSLKTTQKKIAISFDDGPSSDFTPGILQVLNEYRVKAAFFCIGKHVQGNEEILRRVSQEGHLIGNHSYSHHFWFDFFSAQKMTEDLRRADQLIEQATGLKPRLFRPPYGVTTPNLKKAILSGSYIPIGWSVRSFDTSIAKPSKLFNRVIRLTTSGDIILFHDTCATTLDVLPRIIQTLTAEGFEIVRIDELLKIKAYA